MIKFNSIYVFGMALAMARMCSGDVHNNAFCSPKRRTVKSFYEDKFMTVFRENHTSTFGFHFTPPVDASFGNVSVEVGDITFSEWFTNWKPFPEFQPINICKHLREGGSCPLKAGQVYAFRIPLRFTQSNSVLSKLRSPFAVRFIVRSGQVRSGQVRSGQVRSGQVRSGQVRSGQVRSGQVRSGQVRSGQVRSGQVRSGQVRSGQVRVTK